MRFNTKITCSSSRGPIIKDGTFMSFATIVWSEYLTGWTARFAALNEFGTDLREGIEKFIVELNERGHFH